MSMMLYPSIDEFMDEVDSKYTLVIAMAKRARQLQEGDDTRIGNPTSSKHVGVALEEFKKKKLTIMTPSEYETEQV